MARGDSNKAIATELVVSEGTVKFHVKNILRKLRAANRVEAASRYMQLTGKVITPEGQGIPLAREVPGQVAG